MEGDRTGQEPGAALCPCHPSQHLLPTVPTSIYLPTTLTTKGGCTFINGLDRKRSLVLVYQLLQETLLSTFEEKRNVALCPGWDAWQPLGQPGLHRESPCQS